ncbi:hypothetical protein PRZ48_008891 [Zasmidium cellare]|uniref:F-box domain-containing protein n=1 Tax=Zasmidium cellare TaxID=395010 RepID=A0ABR0EGR6_ZASCE|nr:hypothetical protein PRZ48_008891 [Zasmidium cellare]
MATTGLPPRDDVFETTELMEHIVYQLSPLEILTVKRVSKRFKDVIHGSKKILENINFLNVKAPRNSVALNPTIFHKKRTSKTERKNSGTLVGLEWLEGCHRIFRSSLFGSININCRVSHFHGNCRDMAICTALPKDTEVIFPVDILDEDGDLYDMVIEREYKAGTTVTLGDIMGELDDETCFVDEKGEQIVLYEEETEIIIDFGDDVEVYMEGGDAVEEEDESQGQETEDTETNKAEN